MPEAWAARAREMFRSWSMARCAAREPAWARLVPKEEMKTGGVGCRSRNLSGQADDSGSFRGFNLL